MKRGFTIVELVIVVTVISILAGLFIYGSAAMLARSRTAEAKSEMTVIKAGLERYYSLNNEYPSAQVLAGGTGDGRNLTDTQYNNIASLLGVKKDALKGGAYSFMPCWVGSTVCCVPIGVHPCTFPTSDNKYIVYMTRTASDVAAGNVARTYQATTSGCSYTFPAPATPEEAGYSAYFLMYFDQTDPETWTQSRVHSSDRGRVTRGDWCVINKQN